MIQPSAAAGPNPWPVRLRYGAANSVGAAADLIVALGVNALLDPPLWVSAALGVLAGSLVNYVVHQFWTFGGGEYSSRRLAAYLASCGLVLCLRAGLVAALTQVAGAWLAEPVILGAAFAASFLVNYVIAARLFRRAQ